MWAGWSRLTNKPIMDPKMVRLNHRRKWGTCLLCPALPAAVESTLPPMQSVCKCFQLSPHLAPLFSIVLYCSCQGRWQDSRTSLSHVKERTQRPFCTVHLEDFPPDCTKVVVNKWSFPRWGVWGGERQLVESYKFINFRISGRVCNEIQFS